ncbi:MAG: ABC transporter substrate-binding protein [Reichenbachiella sp.]
MKYAYILVLIFLISCQTKVEKKVDVVSKGIIRDAQRFEITDYSEFSLITIDKPWMGSDNALQYVLYKDQKPSLDSLTSAVFVKVPVNSIVSNSTTIIAFLEILGVEDKLTGFAQSQYIYSPVVRERIEKGLVKEVGAESKLDIETILNVNPDILMAFSARDENRQLTKLKELGVNVVMNADYMEESVLGRAEWIKFIAEFVDKRTEADLYYEEVKSAYDSLQSILEGRPKPTVFSGSLYGGSWFMPGGENYGARLMSDAGGDYLWSDNDQNGWLNLDFEAVYIKAYQAEFWIGAADYNSLSTMLEIDERYADFEAFKNQEVYSYINRVSKLGGNDYFESGNANPHLLLADHIKMMHPDLLPEYELYYYRRLAK